LKTRKIETIRRIWAADSERYKVYITPLMSQEELEKFSTQFLKEGEPV